jgi:hypothetical protein
MSFTGKATYSAGATLPEVAEDVSDLISIVSPHETPLSDVSLVRVGDQMRIDETSERVLVTAINIGNGQVTVTRNYGGSPSATISVGSVLTIIGNAALEGDDAAAARFTNRVRQSNFTQIFSATCEVSGSELAVRQLGVRDELDYQKSQRVRELLRDLENSVINGRAPAANQTGSATVRRSMRGIVSFLEPHALQPGSGGLPLDTALSEPLLNSALRNLWESSGANVDLIVVSGEQKRSINSFIAANRRFYSSSESFKDAVSTYESDFGVCRVVLSRYVPRGSMLLLDSSRIDVLPLAGRSFHYKPLATTGDREAGQVIGEYTLELRDAQSMAIVTGLTE